MSVAQFHFNGRQRCYTKYAQIGKNRIFKSFLNHVKIDLETWNFANLHVVVQTDGKKNLKPNGYREGGFLEPPFFKKLSCHRDIVGETLFRRFLAKSLLSSKLHKSITTNNTAKNKIPAERYLFKANISENFMSKCWMVTPQWRHQSWENSQNKIWKSNFFQLNFTG